MADSLASKHLLIEQKVPQLSNGGSLSLNKWYGAVGLVIDCDYLEIAFELPEAES